MLVIDYFYSKLYLQLLFSHRYGFMMVVHILE